MAIRLGDPVRVFAKPRTKRQGYYVYGDALNSTTQNANKESEGSAGNGSANYVRQGGDILDGIYSIIGEDGGGLDFNKGASLTFSDENGDTQGAMTYDGGNNLLIEHLNLCPAETETFDLGTPSLLWRNIHGNATTATKWKAPITLNITGAITGSASVDGSQDIHLNTSLDSLFNVTLWGQSFNGIQSVGGNIAGTGHITPSADGSFVIGAIGNRYGNIYSELVSCDSVNQSSDIRLKENLKSIKDVDLTSINAFSYTMKSNGEPRIGVIAQEVRAVYPELVRENEEGMLSVDYSGLTALLLAEVKELRKAVTCLEEQLNSGK